MFMAKISYRISSIKAMRLMNEEFLGDDKTFNDKQGVIETIETLFPNPGSIKDFVYWLLNVFYFTKNKGDLIEDLFLDAFYACLAKDDSKILNDQNIAYIKEYISKNITFNNTIENTIKICKNDKYCLEPLTLSFIANALTIWTNVKFWNPEKLLELMIHESFLENNNQTYRYLGFLVGYGGLSLPIGKVL